MTDFDAEKMIMQSLYQGNNETISQLNELFPNKLKGLNKELIESIKNLQKIPSLISNDLFLHSKILTDQMGSNNWVISGNFTQSGFPLQSNDPHLQIDRLPTPFYEFMFKQMNFNTNQQINFAFGISVPGIPSMTMGRTKYLSFGFTYGKIDQFDFFIEKIENGKVLRSENPKEYLNIYKRTESIKKKDNSIINYNIYYTEDGNTLELDDFEENFNSVDEILDGFYISSKWVWDFISNDNIPEFGCSLDYSNVNDLSNSLQKSAVSCNYLLADIHGDIIYQQSGSIPNRDFNKYSTILPIPAWWKFASWNSILPHNNENLIYLKNPKEGFIATANDDVYRLKNNHVNDIHGISIHMGPYRADRAGEFIQNKIKQGEKLTINHMKEMQLDLYSKRAERILPIILSCLNNDSNSTSLKSFINLLNNWNYTYLSDSKEAFIFESLNLEIQSKMASKLFKNDFAGQYLMVNSSMKRVIFHYFDNIFVNNENNHLWFGESGSRCDLVKNTAFTLFDSLDLNDDKNYGNQLMPIHFKNIFWNKITSLFNAGPFVQNGNHAVLLVGDYRTNGEEEWNSGAAWRYCTDLNSFESFTSFPGGYSGNIWSFFYKSELDNFLNNKYKVVSP